MAAAGMPLDMLAAQGRLTEAQSNLTRAIAESNRALALGQGVQYAVVLLLCASLSGQPVCCQDWDQRQSNDEDGCHVGNGSLTRSGELIENPDG